MRLRTTSRLALAALAVTTSAYGGCSKENNLDSHSNTTINQGGSGGGTDAATGGAAGLAGNPDDSGIADDSSAADGPQDASASDDQVSDSPSGEASNAGCPQDAGGAMVRVAPGFCIDTTEVTRGQYAGWLTAGPFPALPAECDWKYQSSADDQSVHLPSCDWPPTASADHPVACVDWCDAWAYCTAVGKRLCGQIGTGGPVPTGSYWSVDDDEWFAACSSGGEHPWPYGDTYDDQACHDGCPSCGTEAVDARPACRSDVPEYAPIVGMSGNVAEWENGCDGDAGDSDNCLLRGGGFGTVLPDELACAPSAWPHNLRNARLAVIGFRCCATPTNP